ncbi:hypothetical protein LJC63_08745 [Ruminococcaceae bacterium OttesenSCG-928-L11]|nr:hypothetical protein [Ruminococcaceae bacterium OttesenSCG-928-L11]
MKKSVSILLLAAAMAASVFAGCGNQGGAGAASTGNSGGAGTAAESTTVGGTGDKPFMKFNEVVEVHTGQWINPTDTLPEGKSVDNNQYTDYLLENYNIKIVCDWSAASGSDFDQKVSLCIASDTLPDGVSVSRQYMLRAAKSDMLYDITDLFQEYASDQVKEAMNSTGGRAYTDASYQGKQVALPGIDVQVGGISNMNIRQDWLDQLGLEVPKTVDELETVAAAFAQAKLGGPDTIPIAGPSKNATGYGNFLSTGATTGGFDAIFSAHDAYPGYWITGDDGKVIYGTLTDNTKAALLKLADWYQKGYIDPEMGTRDSNLEPINAGSVGVYMGAWWVVGYGTGDAYRNNPEANWQTYPLYTDDGKWNSHMPSATNGYTIMNKKCGEDQVKAMIIMSNALLRDEKYFDVSEEPLDFYPIRNLMAAADECEYTYHEMVKVLDGDAQVEDYNVEDSVYKLLYSDVGMVKDGIPGYSKGAQLSVSDFDMQTNFGNFQRLYSLMVGCRPFATVTMDKAVYSETYSMTATMETKWANLKTKEDEMILKIITGKSDISAFDAFVQEWLAEGGADITAEVQELADMQ